MSDILGVSGSGLPEGGNDGQVISIVGGEPTWVDPGTASVEDGSITNAKVNATAAIAESKLNLASDAAAGTASRRTLGTGAQQAAAGNHSHTGLTEQAAGTPSVRAIGSTGTTVVAGNDARLTDTRTPTDASVTNAKLATALKSEIKAVAVHNGTSYPSRPSGYASVEWIGPDDPAGSAQNGDTWIPTT